MLDGVANLAAVEESAYPCDVGIDLEREAVSRGVDRTTQHLTEPRHLDTRRAGLPLVAIEIEKRSVCAARHKQRCRSVDLLFASPGAQHHRQAIAAAYRRSARGLAVDEPERKILPWRDSW